jgi:ferredoxin-NADP reductase
MIQSFLEMKTAFLDKKRAVLDIYTFIFQKPADFSYFPGQYIYLTLNNVTKQFSLSSSPTEKFLSITTKVHANSPFKLNLEKLEKGNLVEIEGPNGVFFIDKKSSGSHYFIAGGLGITPFRSITKFIIDNKLNPDIYLFYKYKKGYNVFEKELLSRVKLENKISKKNAIYWVTGPNEFVNKMEGAIEKLGVKPENIISEKFTGLV